MLGWAGLRGAVPVVLATFPVIEHVADSRMFFNIVFFAVVISTLLQGTTFEPLAKRLGVTTTEPALPRPLAETGTIRRLGAEVLEFPVRPDYALVGHRVRDLGLPRDALLSVIVRGEEAVLPRGSTRIEADDRLHVVVRIEVARQMDKVVERWEVGPVGLPPVERQPSVGSAVFSSRPWDDRARRRRRVSRGDRRRRGARAPAHAAGRARRPRLADRRPLRGDRPERSPWGARSRSRRTRRRRLARETDDTVRAWWQEVIGALAR